MLPYLYILPAMVAGRYVYNRVIRETENTVTYGAVQRDIQRDVIVETLRPECIHTPAKVQLFLETARLQAKQEDPSMGCSLELFFADDTWHYARERLKGESLENMRHTGQKLAASSLCELMILLCRSCIGMEMAGVDNEPFSLDDIYVTGNAFRYNNPMVARQRPRTASRRFLSQAAGALRPLLDEDTLMAQEMAHVLESTRHISEWSRLEPVLLNEKLVSIQTSMMIGKNSVSEPNEESLAVEVETKQPSEQ